MASRKNNMSGCIIRDDDLVSIDDIKARMDSIAKQRDRLCETPARFEHSDQFRRRQEKIARLTAREDALRRKLRDALRS